VFKLLLFLHLLAVVFAVGPLVGAASTAARALRTSDATAATSAARTVKIYSYASVVVVVLGFGLMSAKPPGSSDPVADFGESWVWLSLVFWGAAIAVALGGLEPALRGAASTITEGSPVSTMTGRVAAFGGATALLYAAIVALMVYQPGG
jgi:hypothetical protein